jgi:UDP-N-acetylglucosamine 2-epimerase (non-hydrolysing)
MILISYGTRPEWIKIKPIIDILKENRTPFKVLFTGQHTQLANYDYDYTLDVKKCDNRLNEIISAVLNSSSKIFEGIEYVLVQGDTASTYAVALTAFNHKVKVIHLEAGLRTYDLENPYPEEAYRQMISRITDIHLCATSNNKQNLIDEKNPGQKYVVGNTVLDNLKGYKSSYNNEILVTMHRRENHEILDQWFNNINKLATMNPHLRFTIPLHPNPNVQKYKHLLTSLNVRAPLEYDEMIKKISECRFIISDSGGIQEEASFLNKKVIVCRKFTERTESLQKHSFLCKTPAEVFGLFDDIENGYIINEGSPYGDGNASKRIYNILIKGENDEFKNI